MRYLKLPSERFIALASWPLAAMLVAMAYISPGPMTIALLLSMASALLAVQSFRTHRLTGALLDNAEALARSLDLLEAAEGLAGYGRWCIELKPRRHVWSEEMCHLAGVPPGTVPRMDILRRIMPEGLSQIETVLNGHERDRNTFTIEFEVEDRDKECRVLRARARNLFSPEGVREQVFMVVRDVTENYLLRRDRDEAIDRLARAQHEANTDALTGLANRRYAMAELDRAVVEAKKEGELLSIIVFDIDHFKRVNDRHGHPVGDKVIIAVGEIATRQARELDIVGRIGGEEFLWIMPGCDSTAALCAAERLRWAVEAGTHSAPIPSITISAGHAQLAKGDTSLALFGRADAALYESKRSGRNCVTQAA